MTAAIFLGIDPGLSGALAFHDPLIGGVTIRDMPTKQVKLKSGKLRREIDCLALGQFIEFMTLGRDVRACIEKVSAMPGQGVTSMFSFGRALGVIEGELGYAGIDPVYVTPQVWQKNLFASYTARTKTDHLIVARHVWPAYSQYFARKKDDGRADAALILDWFIRQEGAT